MLAVNAAMHAPGSSTVPKSHAAYLNEVSQFAGKASLILQLDVAASDAMLKALPAARESQDPSDAIAIATRAADALEQAQGIEAPPGFSHSGEAAVAYAQHAEESFRSEAAALQSLNSDDLQKALKSTEDDAHYAAALLVAFKADLKVSKFSSAEQTRLLGRLKGQ